MIIRELYSEDDTLFKPIKFYPGFNVILGEKSEKGSLKRNGVGKTIAVEFLNFMLLNDLEKSRLSKIPKYIYRSCSVIYLDIEIYNKPLTIKRELENPTEIVIIDNGFHHSLNIVEARKYILSKFKFKTPNLHCTFRSLIQPLCRDERCEFKSIPNYSDTNIKVPIDYKCHVFYLGLNNDSLCSAMLIKEGINDEVALKTKVKQQVEMLSGKSVIESRAELNRLNKEKYELDKLVKSQSYSIFDKIDENFNDTNLELKKIRTDISSLKIKIKQAQSLVISEDVDIDTVKVIYSKISHSLSNVIVRSIGEAIEFKRKIESYTNNIVYRKVSDIKSAIDSLEERRDFLLVERDKYKSKDCEFEYDINEAIGNLAILERLISDLERNLNRIDTLDSIIKRKKIELNEEKLSIELQLQKNSGLIKSFEEKILDIHQSLFDDYSASFRISVNNRKEIISFDLRIKEDGGHSNERAKVFIYDFSLLMHDQQYSNHLGFLIHDNIFDNDDDTLKKSLNYIERTLRGVMDKQYILTLNSDKLDNIDLDFDINLYTRAVFTKSNNFLGTTYDEV
jgi:uncharacterized protein YydD (DUF2326 family)